jgi:hypothetical protein
MKYKMSMTNEDNTRDKTDNLEPKFKLKEKRPRIGARENFKPRKYKGRVL